MAFKKLWSRKKDNGASASDDINGIYIAKEPVIQKSTPSIKTDIEEDEPVPELRRSKKFYHISSEHCLFNSRYSWEHLENILDPTSITSKGIGIFHSIGEVVEVETRSLISDLDYYADGESATSVQQLDPNCSSSSSSSSSSLPNLITAPIITNNRLSTSNTFHPPFWHISNYIHLTNTK